MRERAGRSKHRSAMAFQPARRVATYVSVRRSTRAVHREANRANNADAARPPFGKVMKSVERLTLVSAGTVYVPAHSWRSMRRPIAYRLTGYFLSFR